MSLSGDVTLFAERVATEFNSLRGDVPFKFEEISQVAYDALSPPDATTIYFITS